jgi:hypothetical protein
VYCFWLPCVKQYSFQKCIVFGLEAPNPLFYRCKLLAILKTSYFFGLLGKTSDELKTAFAIGGRLAVMLLHALCVFLCIPLFDCKMRTLIGQRPLLGNSTVVKSVLFLASLCKTVQFSKVYCFWLPCVKQYSFQKCIVFGLEAPNPLFYRCKLLAILKTGYFFGLLGKTSDELKRAIAIGGRPTMMLLHALCVFLCIPLFEPK